MRSTSLRKVTDMVQLGTVYDNIMKSVNEFASIDKRIRTERFVFDIQISAGTIILITFDKPSKWHCSIASASEAIDYKKVF
jgi:hypothetical protein